MTPNEKLMTARCRLLTVEPWYGHMAMMMRWGKSEEIDTMAVRVLRTGYVECIWNETFVETRTLEELFGVVQHEIEHLVRVHCTRRGVRQAYLWNLACDMCVNGTADSPRVGYKADKVILPLGENSKETMIWIPKDWPNDETADYYYERIMQDDKFQWARDKAAAGEMAPGGMIDGHEYWETSDVTPEEARQIVNGMAQDAAQRSAGNVPGHLASVLEKLAEPIVSWSQVLKRFMGRHLGNRRKTYSRRDRRADEFGKPGFSHRNAARASIIIDTSGSISQSDLEQFFAEIERICLKTKVVLLQWDHAFQGFNQRYRRGDWKTIKICGRGGTDMVAPVEWLHERGLAGDCCIMLTDGYCSYAEEKPFPMITCLSTDDGAKPNWGDTITLNPGRKEIPA